MVAKKDLDVHKILVGLGMPEEMIEVLGEVNRLPELYDLEGRAALGLVLKHIGEKLLDISKKEALEKIGPDKEFRFEMEGELVKFSYRKSQVRTNVNVETVKVRNPQDKDPDYWVDRTISPFIVISAA